MGRSGLRDVASLNCKRSREAATALSSIDGIDLRFNAPFFNEFVVDFHRPAAGVLDALARREILGGIDLGRYYPELRDCALVTATELTTSGDIAALATALEEETRGSAVV
jgi:glycine dehydrogenase subunit 1